MKWLVVVLVILNCLFWYGGGWLADGWRVTKIASGRLPRVAELKVIPPSVKTELEAPGEPERQKSTVGRDPVAPIPAPESAETGSVMPRVCVEIGGFVDRAEALSVATELSLEEGRFEVRRDELPETPYYWVIVPPASSRAEAVATFRELQRRGVDSYLVTEGEQDNAVSLGLFAAQDRAEQLMAERNSQGVDTMLARLPRNRLSYALVFEAGSPSDRQSGDSWKAAYEGRYDSVKFSDCKGVATAKNNP